MVRMTRTLILNAVATPATAVRVAALAAAAFLGPLAAWAVPSHCSVSSAPGCIDTRDAAIGGAADAIVVETRPGDIKSTGSGAIDTDTDLAFVLIVR